ncbi:GNAT family N-acetyltransferase [Sediminibacillus massiliensis]|uniref:GNAT family N-acetyltransferase n=1 Tax=Sediminibacillus massiliensis TaxID=1926277 RepID=UPI000A070A49|nr:GNAT family N-acetyltransferase [Sediminibacillus massiliensis]
MEQGLLQIRKLTTDDWETVKQMETNIEDDYVLHIFPHLVESSSQDVFGMFHENNLLAIAGYTIFPGGYAMLGRLRSNKKFLSKGFATDLLAYIIEELKKNPDITWVGANTNVGNKPARRVLEKLTLSPVTTLHSIHVKNRQLVGGTSGDLWQPVENTAKKRELLDSVTHNAINVFPYECYYPLPFKQTLVTDEYLEESAFYLSPDKQRFMTIRNDQKRDWYAQVKYFWDDHFEQPGFWETAFHYADRHPLHPAVWIDFSEEGFKKIPDKQAFELSDPWILYGDWIEQK